MNTFKFKRKMIAYLPRYLYSFLPKKWKPICDEFDEVIQKFNHKNFRFVQIGACDGIRSDPIYHYVIRYKWRGFLYEPVPYLYQKLIENYKGCKGLHFFNEAVSDKAETKTLYYLDEKLPDYFDQSASFSRKNLLRVIKVNEKKCDCIGISQIPAFDLLVIDTEGYDYKLSMGLFRNRLLPKIIIFEHHLMSEKEKEIIYKEFNKRGYNIIKKEGDAMAWRKDEKEI